MRPARNDLPRDFVERFRVESRLGRGGMGDVYKAYDTVLERTVAVKTLTPGNAGAQAVERLMREARACARLTHPGIVVIHDVLQVEGSVHIVMEHLEGASLASLHRFPRLSTLEGKIDVIVRILDALHYAHGRGVVHRDIKPTNVQILPDGSVKLLDFGIAHVAGAAALTVTGTVTGTAHYASPEQLRGEESDARTDVYSTGILAYEVLTRRRPFEGDSIASVLTKVLNEPLPSMGTSLSENFPDIERIVRRATAKRPQDRYAGAEDMKNALAAFLASSREAIVTRQAEIAARTQRLIIEARSLITGGRAAEATSLLTSVLRDNPDAEEARELLHSGTGASTAVADAPAAPSAFPESTVRLSADQPTAGTDVSAGPAPESTVRLSADQPTAGSVVSAGPAPESTVQLAPDRPAAASTPAAETSTPTRAAHSTAPGPSSVRSGRRLLLAAAPVLMLLAGVVVLGPRWMSPGSRGDASPVTVPAAVQSRPGDVATGVETPEAPPADLPVDARADGGLPASAGAEDPAGGGRQGARDGVAGSVPVPTAAPSPAAPATPPAARPASPAEPLAAPVPNRIEPGAPAASAASSPEPAAAPEPSGGAKDLYYAATRPGPAASAGGETTPAPMTGEGPVNAGLKYRILRREPGGEAVEVDADIMFRSGDRIRFAFEPNIDGFLYVIQRGSTGRWSVLLPHPMINGGRNTVTRFDEVTIPREGWFRFDENPGSEELFVYLSRNPIDTFPWGGGPVVSAQSVDRPTVIELANSVRSRDLTFEKEDAPGGADRAAYVVNQGALGDAVAWTVELQHQ